MVFAANRDAPTRMLALALAVLLAACSRVAAGDSDEPPSNQAGIEFFETKIRPVLVERCYSCHSSQAKDVRGGFRLDSNDGLLAGGDRGPALVPFEPDSSVLIEAIRYANEDLRMPPVDAGGRLSDQQVADFEAWVKAGAPQTNATAATEDSAESRLSAARQFWSFQPIRDPTPPAVQQTDWVKTEVDRFILAELEKKGLEPSAPADRRTLLRRVKYDLLGLPPTFSEMQDFENDASPNAYEVLIERYLASPQFGERWGRHWLDVARYADTKGYAYAREERRFVHAHAYRDWVIRALNDDMPYDLFLVRQIAGDQLDDPDKSNLAAMGFLTVGRRFINVIHDIIDDRIDVVCRGTMGLTVSCARCHDHKFDPIPTSDYYSLYGVFHGSTETMAALNAPADSPTGQMFEKELVARQEALTSTFEAKRLELLDRLRGMVSEYLAVVPEVERLPTVEFYMTMGPDEVNPVIVRQWHTYLSGTPPDHPLFAPWHAYALLPANEFAARAPGVKVGLAERGIVINPLVSQAFADAVPASISEVSAIYGRLFSEAFTAWKAALEAASAAGGEAPTSLEDPAQEELRLVLYGPQSPINLPPQTPAELEFFFAEAAREELGKAQAKIDEWIVEAEGAPPHAVILQDRPVQGIPHVLVRGNPKNQGREVPRRFLEVLSGPDRRPFEKGSGRLELARAIASPNNPLTARVMVNRIWLHLLGEGLVRTPSDFGTRSDPPSHPELLDYLASRFIESGWSIKSMARLILLSSTYTQASADNPGARDLDPSNWLLARANRRRLDFEATRDSLLAVSGQLESTIGGRPADLTSWPFPRRRTIYGFIDRLNLPTMYRAFDFPSPDTHTPERHRTTVPQQALFMMNDPFVMEQARALAAHPDVAAASNSQDRIETLYRLIFARSATPEEIALALPVVEATVEAPTTDQSAAEQPVLPGSAWTNAWASCEASTGQIADFARLPYFSVDRWHAGPQLPDLKCGWASLTAKGGTPGCQPGKAVIRRWTAPRSGTIEIEGSVSHSAGAGDGIRARILHSRLGEVASWTLRGLTAATTLSGIPVEAGETIDFVVDGRSEPASDDFSWAPIVRMPAPSDGSAPAAATEWDSGRDFAGSLPAPLGPWERYVHVLLQSNEFIFVD